MAQDNPAFTASCSDISLDVRASERLPGSQAPTAPTAPTPRVANGSAQNGETQLVKWPRDAEADDYDPYEHHQVAHPTTNTDTLFHLLKGCFGSGILAMPEAFKFAGYVLGTVGTAIIGVLATLAVHLLINAEYALAKRRRVPTLTYPETGRAAFEDGPARTRWMAKYMKGCIDAFVLANQFGCCISYIIFVASNIQAVVERYTTGDPLSLRWYMAFVTIALVLLSWVRDLKYLAPCSTVAMTITLASFGVILYYVFRTVPSLEDKIPFGSVGNFPLFFGTAMFSMEAMGVMIPLKNEMRTPRAFGGSFGVLNRGMAPIVVLFMCVGLFGYLQYGETVNAAITLNLPQDDILAQCVRLGMAVALFFSHGLMNYVNFDAVWHKWLQPRCEARKLPRRIMITSEYLVRTGIVLLQFMIGVIFPNLGLLISLVGALCLSMIGLTFPAMIHMATFWYSCSSRRSFLWLVTKDSLIALLGVFALVIGTATSIDGIIRDSSGG